MRKVVTLPLAKQDINEAAKWYSKRQYGLCKRFMQEVRKKVKFIRQYPESVAISYDDIRTTVLDAFPYMIHFSIDDQKKLVIIIATLRTHRYPELWGNID